MKKVLSIALAIMIALTVSVSAMAADVDFVSSIANKGAPDIVITEEDDSGRKIVGHLRGPNDEILSIEYDDCIVITPIGDAQTSTDIPDESRDKLLFVYEELNKADTSLSELWFELNDIVKDKLGDDKNADDLVIRDLFDISEKCEDLEDHLPTDDSYIRLSFNLGIPKDTFVTTMVYADGEWIPVNTVNNGDGTISCDFNKFGQVAILVPADADKNADTDGDSNNGTNDGINDGMDDSTDSDDKTDVPVTGDSSQSQLILWVAVMGASLTAMAVLAVVFFKKKKQ